MLFAACLNIAHVHQWVLTAKVVDTALDSSTCGVALVALAVSVRGRLVVCAAC